jgi:hypothetical protein
MLTASGLAFACGPPNAETTVTDSPTTLSIWDGPPANALEKRN